MAKKKKHSPIIIFRNDTSPHSPVAYDTKVYNDIKQITSVSLLRVKSLTYMPPWSATDPGTIQSSWLVN